MKKGLKVDDFKCTVAFSMAKQHVMVYSGLINNPGSAYHGKMITKRVVTPKVNGVFQDAIVSFWVDDGTAEPPVFERITLLMAHYNLKLVQVE